MKIITRSIWILSLVSLFTDISSEMLYPIMPLYLSSIGFSVVLIGVLEGIAEAIAGLSKGYFGKLSDIKGKRLPFVQVGYLLSALSKPMMAVLSFPIWVFFARTLDRLGKGIRTGARDAMLSDETLPEHKGKVFGFHRSMDTLGAVIGPISALIYLHYYPENYKTLFFIAFAPALMGVFVTIFLKEKKEKRVKIKIQNHFFSFLKYWKESPKAYRQLSIGLLAFTLFNSSDIFLLLMIKQNGLSDADVIRVYIFYNLIYALFAYPIGVLADNIGLKKTFIIGLALFVLTYLGMAFNTDLYIFYGLFFLYGLYAAFTESIAKAWISNISDKKDTATAIGTYTSFNSIFTMLASSLTGFIWYKISPSAAFLITATGVFLVIIYFFFIKIQSHNSEIINPS
ncbi:MAG: MFS transporter [Bacteroidota bacterium]